jgi:hypothetical protein
MVLNDMLLWMRLNDINDHMVQLEMGDTINNHELQHMDEVRWS